jgi:4-alpha-glucanotransferase
MGFVDYQQVSDGAPPVARFERAAGVAVPLFSLRGEEDLGSGEILDLVPFIQWLDRWQQRIVQLLPINETAPGEASPYNALSAFAIDPPYVSTACLEDVTSSEPARSWLASPAVQRRARRLRQVRRRCRRTVCALKLRLLAFAFEWFDAHAAGERRERFDDFCRTQSWWLDDYALFRALKDQLAWASWQTWPEPLRRRDTDALREAAAALARQSRFFRYVQWIAAEQWERVRLEARARGVRLMGDLPFVCGYDSADVWAHQELFDPSSSAGAPPDGFSPTGQAWGLPLYHWAALRRSDYEWWRQRVRRARTLYDVFRVDHEVGLYRTYAMPTREGGTAGFVPPDEQEQLQQGEALLRAMLAEAGDATRIVAEDLGTVPEWVRTSLTQLGIPGYKVFRWELRGGAYIDPHTYPALSVATTGTHDTNTLVAWWEDLRQHERAAVLRALELPASERSSEPAAPLWTALHGALLRRLYEAGSALTVLPIQDLFGWRERINTPATVGRRNWGYRLPAKTSELDQLPGVRGQLEMIREMTNRTGRNAARLS